MIAAAGAAKAKATATATAAVLQNINYFQSKDFVEIIQRQKEIKVLVCLPLISTDLCFYFCSC